MPTSPARTPRRAVFGCAQPLERQDEERPRDDQVDEIWMIVDARLSLSDSRLLEHLEHAVGDQEAADDVGRGGDHGEGRRGRVLSVSCCPPAMMIAPTTAIAEIALVSDISGVCSSGDTRRMTSRPRNVASRKTNSAVRSDGSGLARSASRSAARCFGMASYGSGADRTPARRSRGRWRSGASSRSAARRWASSCFTGPVSSFSSMFTA